MYSRLHGAPRGNGQDQRTVQEPIQETEAVETVAIDAAAHPPARRLQATLDSAHQSQRYTKKGIIIAALKVEEVYSGSERLCWV